MLSSDEAAFLESLYEKYAASLFVYSFSMLKPLPDALWLAEECVQDTFVKALLMDRLRNHPEPFGWLRITCRNITLSKKRKIKNRRRILGGPLSGDSIYTAQDPADCIEEWILKNDLTDARETLLASLTDQELLVYQAYYERDLSLKDTAEILGLSGNSVRGALQRIKNKLGKLILTILLCFMLHTA